MKMSTLAFSSECLQHEYYFPVGTASAEDSESCLIIHLYILYSLSAQLYSVNVQLLELCVSYQRSIWFSSSSSVHVSVYLCFFHFVFTSLGQFLGSYKSLSLSSHCLYLSIGIVYTYPVCLSDFYIYRVELGSLFLCRIGVSFPWL